jgi:hypothetical protein
MATRDGSDPALKFHPMDSPAAAPIGIHLRTSKNVKLPPICAFLLIYNKLPKHRTWVRFSSLKGPPASLRTLSESTEGAARPLLFLNQLNKFFHIERRK